LVGLDLLALLLQPLRDRPLGDGDAHLRHHDVDGGFCGHATRPGLTNPRGSRLGMSSGSPPSGPSQYSARSRTPATTSSIRGMNAFSSGGENGTGVSGAVMRFTGASRSSNASSAIVAAI